MKREILLISVIFSVIFYAACARPLASGSLATGVAAARLGDWDEAVRQWTAALERDPSSAAAHNNLAVAFERKGAWEDARREYDSALRLDPDNQTIRENFEAFKARAAAGRRESP